MIILDIAIDLDKILDRFKTGGLEYHIAIRLQKNEYRRRKYIQSGSQLHFSNALAGWKVNAITALCIDVNKRIVPDKQIMQSGIRKCFLVCLGAKATTEAAKVHENSLVIFLRLLQALIVFQKRVALRRIRISQTGIGHTHEQADHGYI